MKKIMMTAAIGALCATVAFGEGVTSGIVGYQTLTVPQGYSMYCVTFKGVGDVAYDCTNIKVLNSAGKEMNDDNTTTPSQRSRNKVIFQKLNLETGSLDATNYKYNSQGGKGWCAGSTKLNEGDLTFANGEGIYINNTQGAPVQFQYSGQVDLTPVSMALAPGYSLVGNMCPVAVDLSNVKVLNSEGLEMNDDNSVSPSRRSRNKIIVQLLDSTSGSLEATNYKYNSQGGKGWCEGSTKLTEGQMMLQPGQSFYLNNTQGATVYLQFPTILNP